MMCRYCQQELKSQADNLVGRYGQKCEGGSENGRHVAMPDGANCVYCGKPVKNLGGRLVTNYGESCKNSPTKTHQLF